jgi:multisubunit Na+/H+ antiporter MnhC subunit
MTFEGVWYVSINPGPFGKVEKWTWVESQEEFDHLGRLLALACDAEGADYRFEPKGAYATHVHTRTFGETVAELNGGWRSHWRSAAGREQKPELVSSPREPRVLTESSSEMHRRSIPSNLALQAKHNYRDRGRPYWRPRFKGLRGVAIIWGLAFVVTFIANAAYPIPEYLWAIPLLLTLCIGSILGYRIAQHAFGAGRYGVESIWKTRIVMTLGLLGTGAILFIFLVSAALASFTIPSNCGTSVSGLPLNCSNPGQSYQLATQLESNFVYMVGLFLGPIVLGFAMGEAYLLYRLRHYFTVSRY